MSDQTIESRLIEVISDQLGVAKADVTPTTNFVEDLGADSLDGVELVMAVEEEFDIEIDDAIGQGFKTLQDVVDYVTKVAAS
jgi:acyl carrier protein